MPHLLAVIILLLVTVALMYLMLRGWNNRGRRIVVDELPELPAGPWQEGGSTTGIYVTTTLAGMPYERVVTRGLGVKAAVEVYVRADGVVLQRQGATDLFIPRADLQQVRTTSGMIGKFAAPDSIVVLRWSAGSTLVDTGVHIRGEEQRRDLLQRLTTLLNTPDESRNP